MLISDLYPSTFLKASDITGTGLLVHIKSVGLEEFDDGEKPMLSFSDSNKKLVLNKTNARTICKIYGLETDAWVGKPVTLVQRQVEFGGKLVPAIRIATKLLVKPSAEANADMDSSDDFPF